MLHNLNQAYTPIERPLAFGPHYNPASLATRKTNCQFDIDFGQGQFPFSLTRTTTATYIDRDSLIQSVASGIPRFTHNFITKRPLGILLEEERTNVCLRSEELDHALWVSTATVSRNAAVAPDGETTAEEIASISAAPDAVGQNIVLSLATEYTMSIFVKQVDTTLSRVGLWRLGGSPTWMGYVEFAWSAGVPSTSTSAGATGITYTEHTNNWWRISFQVTSDVTTATHTFFIMPDRNALTRSGYFWGTQLEAAADVISSYIPTIASAVTRRADDVSLAVSSLPLLADGFSFYIEAVTALVVDTALNTGLFSVDDLTSNEQMSILLSSATDNLRFLCMDGGVIQANNTVTGVGFDTLVKAAGRFFLNDFAYIVNGGAAYTDAAGTLPTVTSLNLGNLQQNLASMWDGPIGRFLLYEDVISDEVLQIMSNN